MAAHFFVTGTDTDAGKTYCSTALLRGLLASGVRCAALKPIASGVDAAGHNTDASALAAVTGQFSEAATGSSSPSSPSSLRIAASCCWALLAMAEMRQLALKPRSPVAPVPTA